LSYVTESHGVDELISGSRFVAYTYSYPHKMAHRPLEPPVPLAEAWDAERRDALFLYVHVPFCESRCGFCNLFSLARPDGELAEQYLAAVRRQARSVRNALGRMRFARLALGGGTPTFFSAEQLQALLKTVTGVMEVEPKRIPVSVEASPRTLSRDKLVLLREAGGDRLSLGVQVCDDQGARSLGRPHRRQDVEHALALIREAELPVLNVDLMYGADGQTVERWLATVHDALTYAPEELYLYPLYVRPLTGLGKRGPRGSDLRLTAYREARALLLDAGYRQVSLRMFRARQAAKQPGPVYCCQEDGMIGIGCGARSYTRRLHYSSQYAVPPGAVRRIIESYVGRSAESFKTADHGYRLDAEDQRRRYVILSLLQTEGLSRADYRRQFGNDALDDLPQLRELEPYGLMEIDAERLRLTPAGLERSDAVGPWLYSARVRRRVASYQWQLS